MEHALAEGLERVFILEDDVDFPDNFMTLLNETIKQLPEDWDGIHLGGYSHTNHLDYYSGMLYRCYRSCGGYGYIVRSKAIPKILEKTNNSNKQFDINLADLMPELKWFKSKIMLVKHLPGFSDIQGRHVDYKELY